MNDITTKAIVLKLNRNWESIQVCVVAGVICDLINGVIDAVDIRYALNDDGSPNFEIQEYINPVGWDEWVKLPVYPWQQSIHSAKLEIRVPTVVIAKNYSKMPEKKFRGKPTKEGLAYRDDGIDGYTGLELDLHEATIDHVVPLSRGGTDTYDNTVLTRKDINNRKGNRLNSEIGLPLLVNPHTPKSVPVNRLIRKIRHPDWRHFLRK